MLNIKKIEVSSSPKGTFGHFLRDLYMNLIYIKLENRIKEYII